MKITVEFDTWEEMEVFRTSGKKTRGKSQMTEVEEAVELQASRANPADTRPEPAPVAANPVPPQSFTPPVAQQATGFPGANGPTPSPTNTLVTAILARIDGAISSGQPAEAILTWFRQQIGPEAANATVEQLKQVFIPRMSKAQLESIAPQLGISVQ